MRCHGNIPAEDNEEITSLTPHLTHPIQLVSSFINRDFMT